MPAGEARTCLLDALSSRSVQVESNPDALALGSRARLVLASGEYLGLVCGALGPGVARVALLGPDDDPDAALSAGADELVSWPGSSAVLQKRIGAFLDGRLGPSRIVLDTTRVSSLVHAIRNPLNVITLYSELLKMEPLSNDALGSVGRLVRSAKRVDALVGELETLLYLEAELAPVRHQPTELGELVELVVAELRYDIEDKPLELDLELGTEGTLGLVDPDLARRVVHAVLGRVAKLCLGGSKVQIRTLADPCRIVISAPIEPIAGDHIEVMHTPATELDVRESLGGVGVGLSFAHRAMRAMGGYLEHGATDDGRALTSLVFTPAG